MRNGLVVLDEIDLFHFDSTDKIEPFLLNFDTNLLINSFQNGLDYKIKSKAKDHVPPAVEKCNYLLKKNMTMKCSLAALIDSNADEENCKKGKKE